MTRFLTDPEELSDARESLSYWEQRAQRLPLRAVRKRREARVLARRWSVRVAEAERARYGAGLLGFLLIMLVEGRPPEATRHAGRRAARWMQRASAATAVTVVALAVMAVAACVELAGAIVGAIS